MVLRNATSLSIGCLLVVLVMAMVGVEDVGELSGLVLGMYHLDHGLLKLCARELTLDLLDLLAGPVVKRVKQSLFEASLPRTIRGSLRHDGPCT